MRTLIKTVLLALLAGGATTLSLAQCGVTIDHKGRCEGVELQANTTGGILEQLTWRWKSQDDSIVLIITGANFYPDAITVAGGNGDGTDPDQLDYPSGIDVDKAGNVYVTSYDRVQKWAPGAKAGVTVAGGNGHGSAANQIDPFDIKVDEEGNIYISDNSNNRVQKWAPGATAGITVAGGNGYGSGANQLVWPEGIAFDKAGNLYVMDTENGRVQKWAPGASAGITVAGGNGLGKAANQIAYGSGIYVDEAGNIYVAERGYYNNRVQKWAPGAAEGITVAGNNTSGSKDNQLNNAIGVYVDVLKNVYVADNSNHRIQKWAPGADSGITVAGGHYGKKPDELTWPVFLCFTGDTMYVSDGGNDRVQKFIPGNTAYTPENGGNYTVTAVFQDGCTATSEPVHIKGLPKFTHIKGQHRHLCGGSVFTYSVDSIEDAENYTWIPPAGCTIVSGQGTPSIQLSIPAGFDIGALGVFAYNRCGSGPVYYDTLSTKPDRPDTIYGPTAVLYNDTVTYSVHPKEGLSYSWEMPLNVIILSGQNTPSVTIKWTPYNNTGNVVVHASACSAEASRRLTVTTAYSTIAATTNSEMQAAAKPLSVLQVYPNPAHNSATLVFNAATASRYTILISDAAGKTIQTVQGTAMQGANKVQLNTAALSNGTYFITLLVNGSPKQSVQLSRQ